ncbi:DUF2259 domain-containing protein [Brucepastera parasyntrophica]|uniref:DUF2259 domain-containing protein n=1 Tax=Brucepastera parasyntrophica TaxID=2880008 RepID=UPI002109825B|nr:DUF2259 domain-containing protein [Brucepastera parasyntrophica]ULQ60855.1 DUF2259 domain-containing protein [Brucepastera parasyntrophica]
MRKLAVLFLGVFFTAFVHAGDVATFMDLGFSADGKTYTFGQYGITDTRFQAYADIFCVDVSTNKFIPGGTFSTNPDSKTSGQEGRIVFASLQKNTADFMKKLVVDGSNAGRPLYVETEESMNLKEISFRDFETGNVYKITMNVLTSGRGASVQSSFYLSVQITDSSGKVTTRTVGLPGYKRPGVSNYGIRRIVTDNTGKSVVFIIEKEMYEEKGSSIRYMVETFRF